jgi:hypothetical protein
MSPEQLDHLLEQNQPKLSSAEQAELWQRIAREVHTPTPVASPYVFASFLKTRSMVPLLIALMVMIGAGGTVAASEAAKPGDLLFPIERAAERTQLAFARGERAAELRSAFALERLVELEAILAEEGTVLDDTNSAPTTSTTGVRKVVLVDSAGEERVSTAVHVLLDLLDEVEDDSARDAILASLITQIDTISVRGRDNKDKTDGRFESHREDYRLRIDNKRIEVREEGYRIRVDKDGEVRIKSEDNTDDSDDVEDPWEDSAFRTDDTNDGTVDDDSHDQDDDLERDVWKEYESHDEIDDDVEDDSDSRDSDDSSNGQEDDDLEESEDRDIDESEEVDEDKDGAEEQEQDEEESDDKDEDEDEKDSDQG